jgi:hypothetical protein
MYRHVSTRTWFTLFFIPVLPYDNSHFLVCPICSNARQLTKAQAQHAIAMAQHTNLASAGGGYGDAYEQQVNAFWASLSGADAPPPLASPAAIAPPPQQWGQPPSPPHAN